MTGRFVLASASPQRKTLLEGLGVQFDVVPSTVDEAAHIERDPVQRARVLASMKAKDVASKEGTGKWVIGCDTLVVADEGTVLEKPVDEQDARRMIELQSGKTSWVHSGISLVSPEGEEWLDVSSSSVTFRSLSKADVDWWIEKGLWKGRSGSFQIDGLGQLMIERIEGDWTSIVGFPVFAFGELVRKAKLSW